MLKRVLKANLRVFEDAVVRIEEQIVLASHMNRHGVTLAVRHAYADDRAAVLVKGFGHQLPDPVLRRPVVLPRARRQDA